MKRKKRVKLKFVEEGDENWLISYADLMTLLWGFFVILSAYSVPNASLIEKLKETTAKSMGGEYERPFNELTNQLNSILKELDIAKETTLETTSEGIKLTIKASYFFESGETDLHARASEILKKIGVVIKNSKENMKIYVEGHTDDLPISNQYFKSNWELSSNRASTVVRLFEGLGIEYTRLRPIGLASVSPLVKTAGLTGNNLDIARSKNRRIVIKLQKYLHDRISEGSYE